jgi:hypothetical protein
MVTVPALAFPNGLTTIVPDRNDVETRSTPEGIRRETVSPASSFISGEVDQAAPSVH